MHVRIPGTFFTAIKVMKHFANLLDKKLAETGEPLLVTLWCRVEHKLLRKRARSLNTFVVKCLRETAEKIVVQFLY